MEEATDFLFLRFPDFYTIFPPFPSTCFHFVSFSLRTFILKTLSVRRTGGMGRMAISKMAVQMGAILRRRRKVSRSLLTFQSRAFCGHAFFEKSTLLVLPGRLGFLAQQKNLVAGKLCVSCFPRGSTAERYKTFPSVHNSGCFGKVFNFFSKTAS